MASLSVRDLIELFEELVAKEGERTLHDARLLGDQIFLYAAHYVHIHRNAPPDLRFPSSVGEATWTHCVWERTNGTSGYYYWRAPGTIEATSVEVAAIVLGVYDQFVRVVCPECGFKRRHSGKSTEMWCSHCYAKMKQVKRG